MSYCVYRHTSPSGKVYIGITMQKPEQRWKNGRGYRSQRYLGAAIEKYGWDNFKHEILFSGLTLEEANSKEIEQIALHKSDQREFGYNISGGGGNKIVSPETIQRMRASLKGHPPSEYQRKRMSEWSSARRHSPETRKKISESQIGKVISLESRRKMSESHKGIKPSRENVLKMREASSVPVEQIDKATNKVVARFASTMDAFREVGVDPSSISKCCRGKRETVGGYKWRYADKS